MKKNKYSKYVVMSLEMLAITVIASCLVGYISYVVLLPKHSEQITSEIVTGIAIMMGMFIAVIGLLAGFTTVRERWKEDVFKEKFKELKKDLSKQECEYSFEIGSPQECYGIDLEKAVLRAIVSGSNELRYLVKIEPMSRGITVTIRDKSGVVDILHIYNYEFFFKYFKLKEDDDE